MESSENISPSAFQRVKGFLKDVVRYLLTTASDRQVGVILYNSEATKEIAFGQYTSEFGFNEAVDELPQEKGQPRIDAALQLAAEMFATSGGMVFNLLHQCSVAFTKSRLAIGLKYHGAVMSSNACVLDRNAVAPPDLYFYMSL